MSEFFSIACAQPWLVATFSAPQRMVSWSLNRPGFTTAHRVAWLEVRDADLPLGVDPHALLLDRLGTAGFADAVAMMTARDVRRHAIADRRIDGVGARALVTLGLTNGIAFDAVGEVVAPSRAPRVGTINLLLALSHPLADEALLEALSLAATARTAALLADGGSIAATGTDCVVVACPEVTGQAARYAGLHTASGRALAAAAYAAVSAARRDWEDEFAPPTA